MNTTAISTAAASFFLFALPASADLVNIDFNSGTTATGAGVVGTAGDTWNGLAPKNSSASGLVNSDNVGSTVGATWSGWYEIWDNAGNGGPNSDLMDDFLGGGNAGTIILSGLDSNSTYDLYTYNVNDQTGTERYTTVTVEGGGAPVAKSINQPRVASSWVEHANYLYFPGVSPDGSDEITITVSAIALATFNGLQLVQLVVVPEPGTSLLFGLGALIGLRRRRK